MSVCFPVTKDLAPAIINRLVELGYKATIGLTDAVQHNAGYIRVDDAMWISYGAVKFPTPLGTDSSWGSLDDLFLTHKYKVKLPIKLAIGIGEIIVKDHVAFGCKKVTLEEVDMIVKAIEQYKKS